MMSAMDLLGVVWGSRERVVLSSSLPADVVAARIRKVLMESAHPLMDPPRVPSVGGWVRGSRLLLRVNRPGRRNASAPTVHGYLSDAGSSGSMFSGVIGLHPAVEVFNRVWCGFACLGIAGGIVVAVANLVAGDYGMVGGGALAVAGGVASLALFAVVALTGARLARGEADTLRSVLAEALAITDQQ